MILQVSGFMLPQHCQNLGTSLRVPCQMMWAVRSKMYKRKGCPTDHPESKRPPGIWKTTWLGLTPFKLRLTITQQQTAFVSFWEGLCILQTLQQWAVVMVMQPFGQAMLPPFLTWSLSGNHFCGGLLRTQSVVDKWWCPCKWWEGLLNNGNLLSWVGQPWDFSSYVNLPLHPSIISEGARYLFERRTVQLEV